MLVYQFQQRIPQSGQYGLCLSGLQTRVGIHNALPITLARGIRNRVPIEVGPTLVSHYHALLYRVKYCVQFLLTKKYAALWTGHLDSAGVHDWSTLCADLGCDSGQLEPIAIYIAWGFAPTAMNTLCRTSMLL